MKLVYANVYYAPDSGMGGHAHINQFIRCATRLGHEVWTWPIGHPDAHVLPKNPLGKLSQIRRSDALVIRLEGGPPRALKILTPPYRWMLGDAKVVWEFNTVPEFGDVVGQPSTAVREFVRTYSKLAPHCDLAVCVSENLSEYVRDNLGVKNVVTVPNGSDPDMFKPDLEPHPYLAEESSFNVIWMGSAGLSWANFDWIREAARILWEEFNAKHIRLNILGGELRGLRGMTPNVRYLGNESYNEVPRWLAGMDIGLVSYMPGPADYSSPLKFFDYMASGLGVVSTNQPQVAEILNSLGYGECVLEYNQPKKLAQLLVKFDQDRDALDAYRKVLRQVAEKRFSWENSASYVLDEIRKLSAHKK